MVGLPHRADAAIDLRPQFAAGLVAPREQVPDAASEVGTPEQGIEDDTDEQQHGDDVAEIHDGTFVVDGVAEGLGAGGP